jgi:hypothetical protein
MQNVINLSSHRVYLSPMNNSLCNLSDLIRSQWHCAPGRRFRSAPAGLCRRLQHFWQRHRHDCRLEANAAVIRAAARGVSHQCAAVSAGFAGVSSGTQAYQKIIDTRLVFRSKLFANYGELNVHGRQRAIASLSSIPFFSFSRRQTPVPMFHMSVLEDVAFTSFRCITRPTCVARCTRVTTSCSRAYSQRDSSIGCSPPTQARLVRWRQLG